MTRAIYSYALVAGVAVVVDLDGGMSVTNDAENVIADIVARGVDVGKVPVIYRDSMGRWDRLVCEGGQFKGFAPLQQPYRHQWPETLPVDDVYRALVANPTLMLAGPRKVVIIAPDKNSDYVYLDMTKEQAMAKFQEHEDSHLYGEVEKLKITVGEFEGSSFMLWRNIGSNMADILEGRGLPPEVAALFRGPKG